MPTWAFLGSPVPSYITTLVIVFTFIYTKYVTISFHMIRSEMLCTQREYSMALMRSYGALNYYIFNVKYYIPYEDTPQYICTY